MKIIILTVTFLVLSSSVTIRAANNECSKFKSERFISKLVGKARSFDELTIFRKFPKFLYSNSIDSMKQQLKNTSLGFGNIRVTCSNKNHVFFAINTDDKNSLWAGVEGFYRIKDKKYFSGPFSLKEITVVILVDPRSGIHNEVPIKDANSNGAF